jgi:hypothetical protein
MRWRSWAHCRRPPATLQKRPCKCVTHAHGGLTPAAPDPDVALVHRKNRFFVGKRSCSNTRAGGVSPPWYLLMRMRWRSWAHRRQSPATLRKRLCKCITHAHGGLTPAALGCGFANRWIMFDSGSTALGSPSHGGLTPAALLWTCVCASQKSFFRRQTIATQYESGGRKPPVGTLHARTTIENHGKSALV